VPAELHANRMQWLIRLCVIRCYVSVMWRPGMHRSVWLCVCTWQRSQTDRCIGRVGVLVTSLYSNASSSSSSVAALSKNGKFILSLPYIDLYPVLLVSR
jgi:hypothetical protein